LGTNEALEAAKPKTRCVTQPQNASVCSVDFRLESEMRRICEAANGKLWERSIILECYLNNSGTESAEATSDDTKMLFHYYNIPTCLGMSCDVTVAENEFDAFVPGDFEQNLLEERNLTCTARAEPASASSAPSWNPNKWRWNTIQVSALGVVGFWYWTLL
jgi:hypothetical protein